MKLQFSYEIMFGYVQKLQILHLILLKTINIVIYNKFSKPGRLGRAGLIFSKCCIFTARHYASGDV